MKPIDGMMPVTAEKCWRHVALVGDFDIRNWGLSFNVRWYPPQYGRLPVVMAAQFGPFVATLYMGNG